MNRAQTPDQPARGDGKKTGRGGVGGGVGGVGRAFRGGGLCGAGVRVGGLWRVQPGMVKVVV